VTEQRWCAEPFTAGGPVTVLGPGVLTGCGPALRTPVGPVHWAGTETATRWTGYIDGAISSGERAAAEVAAALDR
jgi:monoamine oxidase